jgi:hypothetical protein
LIKGKQIEIWLAQEKEPLFKQLMVFKVELSASTVVGIIPGDYNSDSVMDLLVTYRPGDDTSKLRMSLFLGNKKSQFSNDLEKEIAVEMDINDQPFVAE